ncbi:MAG: hypothetical protein M3409_00910, partial [Gemmatimonadota bacterium]|nr:hypothetical protein [Gemmatimonadota bacterium]
MLSRAEETQLRALRSRRNRQAEGRFLAEGVRVVEDLLASTLDVAFVAAASSLEYSERGAGLRAAAERRGVAWRVAPDAELERLAETDTPQGVLAVARTPRHALQHVPTDGDPSV